MERIAVYAATRNMYKYLPMTIGSLLRSNPKTCVLVIAEDEYIDTLQHPNVVIIPFHPYCSKLLDEKGPNYNSHWTHMTLARLCLPKILHHSRCLWLDVDTIVLDNLDELFSLNMDKKVLAGVMEPRKLIEEENPRPYWNAGVMLMNLDLIRELHLDDKILELINTKKFRFPDQDVLNIISRGRMEYLHPQWNVSPSTANTAKPKIVHFTFKKIWDDPYVKLWKEFYKERLD